MTTTADVSAAANDVVSSANFKDNLVVTTDVDNISVNVSNNADIIKKSSSSEAERSLNQNCFEVDQISVSNVRIKQHSHDNKALDTDSKVITYNLEAEQCASNVASEKCASSIEVAQYSSNVEVAQYSSNNEVAQYSSNVEVAQYSSNVEVAQYSSTVAAEQISSNIEIEQFSSNVVCERFSSDIEVEKCSTTYKVEDEHDKVFNDIHEICDTDDAAIPPCGEDNQLTFDLEIVKPSLSTLTLAEENNPIISKNDNDNIKTNEITISTNESEMIVSANENEMIVLKYNNNPIEFENAISTVSQNDISTLSQHGISTVSQNDISIVSQNYISTVSQNNIKIVSQNYISTLPQNGDENMKTEIITTDNKVITSGTDDTIISNEMILSEKLKLKQKQEKLKT